MTTKSDTFWRNVWSNNWDFADSIYLKWDAYESFTIFEQKARYKVNKVSESYKSKKWVKKLDK